MTVRKRRTGTLYGITGGGYGDVRKNNWKESVLGGDRCTTVRHMEIRAELNHRMCSVQRRLHGLTASTGRISASVRCNSSIICCHLWRGTWLAMVGLRIPLKFSSNMRVISLCMITSHISAPACTPPRPQLHRPQRVRVHNNFCITFVHIGAIGSVQRFFLDSVVCKRGEERKGVVTAKLPPSTNTVTLYQLPTKHSNKTALSNLLPPLFFTTASTAAQGPSLLHPQATPCCAMPPSGSRALERARIASCPAASRPVARRVVDTRPRAMT